MEAESNYTNVSFKFTLTFDSYFIYVLLLQISLICLWVHPFLTSADLH